MNDRRGISRRRFIGYLIAAPTLVAAADLRAAQPADASIPTIQPVDFFDLTDLITDAALLTASFITVTINPDGTASFALPRAEVGQGITTAVAMIIADELELPLDKVKITLADARPELAVQPADRRLELDSLALRPGPGRRGERARAAGAARRPSSCRHRCPSSRSRTA